MYLYAIFGFFTNVFLNVKCGLYAKGKLNTMHQLTLYKSLVSEKILHLISQHRLSQPPVYTLLSKHFALQPFSTQRFSFFVVYLVHCLHEISPGWTAKRSIPYTVLIKVIFHVCFYISLSAAAAIFVGVLEFYEEL